MIRWLVIALLLIASLAAPGPAYAVEPDEILDDPVLEARARELSKEVRCVVCQNESIDTSNAEIARELRLLVRERLVAGESDRQVLDFLVARYGDFVLLKPPFKASTWALWLGPAVILLLAFAGAGFYMRRQSRHVAVAAPLDDDERRRLDELLDDT